MEGHHGEDNPSNKNVVSQPGYSDKHDPVAHRAKNQHPEDRADDGAAAAGQSGTANYDHRNHLQFILGAAVGIGRRHSDRACDPGVSRDYGGQNKERDLSPGNTYPSSSSRFRISTGGLYPVTYFRFGQDVPENNREQDEP